MRLDMKLELRPSLQLVVSPRLVQLLKLLQLPRLELEQLVRQEMEENPLLDEVSETEETPEAEENTKEEEEFDWVDYLQDDLDPYCRRQEASPAPPIEETLVSVSTLRDYLLTQLHLRFPPSEERKIGEFIIDSLHEDGYLASSLEELSSSLGVSSEDVEAVLRVVQGFDPPGIGARSLPECLLIQLEEMGKGGELEAQIVKDHLEDLRRKRYEQIAKKLKVGRDEVKEAVELIATLNPRPARGRWGSAPIYVTPDLSLEKWEGKYRVALNEGNMPHLRVSDNYRRILSSPRDFSQKEVKFVREKLSRARFFIASVEERKQTILKVVNHIVEEQKGFFNEGLSELKPMTLRAVADAVGLHESTVSRVVQRKWIDTPKGLYSLKFFFSGAISQEFGGHVSVKSVKAKIKELIDGEDKANPLTDQSIVENLRGKGFKIARRTVSKYREELGLGSSKLRREV